MYLTFGLLWLGFKIIHGKILLCPIGGLTDGALCDNLIKESVLQKFYIASLNRPIIRNEKNTNELIDTPYWKFTEPAVKSTKNKVMSSLKNITSSSKTDYYMTIFRKTLIYDNTVPIQEYLDQALEIRTDTYLIKFHNMLLYQKNINTILDVKKHIVFIQSFYYAASTYYFSKNYELAKQVIISGLKNINRGFTLNDDDKKQLAVLYILLLRLKIDINNSMNIATENEMNELLQIKANVFNNFDDGVFPISTVLLFREYFLDDESNQSLKISDKNEKIWEVLDINNLYQNDISMYIFLILSRIYKDISKKLRSLFKAIERPVLSTEDRLLNYKAVELILKEFVTPCMKSSENREECKVFDAIQNENIQWKSKIIPKLCILHELQNKSTEHFLEKLNEELRTDNHIIDQDVLNLILNAAIDIDTKSEKYKTNIKNVQRAISLLNKYVESQRKILNVKVKSENSKITNAITNKILKETDEKEPLIKKPTITNYNEEFTTKYSEVQIVDNLLIAYKWLIELNGVLSNNSELSDEYQNGLLNTLQEVNNLTSHNKLLTGTTNFDTDEHFNYLKAKQMSKVFNPRDDWEASDRPGDWKISSCTFDKFKTWLFSKNKNMFENTLYLLADNPKCSYINKIEMYTLHFRYHWKSNPNNYDKMYEYIKKAITEIVITPEDRLKNLEAHELFTMYLMERNEEAIKMANTTEIKNVYKNLLTDPDRRVNV